MPIKSFRGKLASGAQETISLHTNNGSTGYKITKFQILPAAWGGATQEINVKIYSIEQNLTTTPASDAIDFSDNTLLAVACQSYNTSANIAGDVPVVVFDNVTFNQDIYVVAFDADSNPVNYHIELDTVKLSLDENTVATLKDIRNIKSQ
tara:strand:- start:43 stop:492 length:450 start_codon:yes stop_codon:yes gene_type:complete